MSLSDLHAYLASIEATARAARMTLENMIQRLDAAEKAAREEAEEPQEKKVPPTFGDS